LIDQIAQAPKVDNQMMYQHYDHQKQWDFGIDLLKQMGYNFDAGRQDLSEHPFTINFSAQDVRVTTRVSEKNFTDMTWSCIHEGGHALYEQGLPEEQYGLPLGEAVSLGIHESQSRIWENNVARSRAYWELNYGRLQALFPDNLQKVSVEQFYRAVNKVAPSLIRVDADELTYHFHVIIRYEIEKGMLDGSIKPAEAKDAWNAKYKQYLDIEVPDDLSGVLQDVHWSHGGVGYFPTYTLGSLYAAQFFAKADVDLGDLNGKVRQGDFKPLLDWLRTNIHQYGRKYTADELCNRICGESLNASYFMDYARKKYGEVYALDALAAG
jgi:carboxypeptidase Taq